MKFFEKPFLILILAGALADCRKKELPGTAEIREIFQQTDTELQKIAPMLDERAKPETVRQAALNIEHLFGDQYAKTRNILKKYPNLMADRPEFEKVLSVEMAALRESLGLVIRRIKYWQKRMPRDKIFNDSLKRTSKLSSQMEIESRPAE